MWHDDVTSDVMRDHGLPPLSITVSARVTSLGKLVGYVQGVSDGTFL